MASKKVKKSVSKNVSLPNGVKSIAVLNYVLSISFLVLSGFLIVTGLLIIFELYSSASSGGFPDAIRSIFAIYFIIVAVLLFGFSILCFFIAKGLLKRKNWARITQIVVCVLASIIFISRLQDQLLSADYLGVMIGLGLLAVNLIIIVYLLANKSVKKIFSSK